MSDVQFDYDGALDLARRLHALSIGLERVLAARAEAAGRALGAWRGPYGEEFRATAAQTDDEGRRLVLALQLEAVDWADAWSAAINEQNRRRRARQVDEIAVGRGLGEQLVDYVIGDDSDQQVVAQIHLPPPQPPDFTPTGTLQDF